MEIELMGEQMELLPQRALYWPAQDLLLLADLHLGKVNHFRRAGIAVPSGANDRNIELLIELIGLTRPKRVVCLGDLFHSHYNYAWEMFGELVRLWPSMSFELVAGNHDIMSEQQYLRNGIVVRDQMTIGRFIFTHEPLDPVPANLYNISGHIHPAVRLVGKGKQMVTLPCFSFGKNQGLLPAFGTFTGTAKIRPRKNDRVIVIAEDKLIEIE